ncbi:MAG: sulfurtransferase [Pedobacter sp.]|nr:sulfurtransferase [Pedobacter sp.]
MSAQELGINSNSLLVVYDRVGIYSSARVWWMFLAMGFKNCYVLDGGWPEWLKMGYNYVSEYKDLSKKGSFIAKFDHKLISSQRDVFIASNDKHQRIIDARSADRFYGKTAEPRAGLRLGHIPNSINIPFEEVLFEHKLRNKMELERIFENLGDKNIPLTFSCGSGVTACIDALAATVIGYQNLSVYDGSWSEWGMD